MAIVTLTCPRCEKQFKSDPELYGKRVRCPACQEPFVIPSPDGKIDEEGLRQIIDLPDFEMQREADARNAIQAAPQRFFLDEDDGPAQYGVTEEAEVPRCPNCREPMESEDAIVCLNCGYNTVTRTWGRTKKAIETTLADHIRWLLPGLICAGMILVLMIFCLYYCLLLPAHLDYYTSWLGSEPLKMWTVIINLCIMWPLGYFAYRRLIINPTPPDKETR